MSRTVFSGIRVRRNGPLSFLCEILRSYSASMGFSGEISIGRWVEEAVPVMTALTQSARAMDVADQGRSRLVAFCYIKDPNKVGLGVSLAWGGTICASDELCSVYVHVIRVGDVFVTGTLLTTVSTQSRAEEPQARRRHAVHRPQLPLKGRHFC